MVFIFLLELYLFALYLLDKRIWNVKIHGVPHAHGLISVAHQITSYHRSCLYLELESWILKEKPLFERIDETKTIKTLQNLNEAHKISIAKGVLILSFGLTPIQINIRNLLVCRTCKEVRTRINNGKLNIFNAFAKDNEVHNKLVSMI